MYRLRETGVLHMRFLIGKNQIVVWIYRIFSFADSELCDVL